jgi:hypothetical protein
MIPKLACGGTDRPGRVPIVTRDPETLTRHLNNTIDHFRDPGQSMIVKTFISTKTFCTHSYEIVS